MEKIHKITVPIGLKVVMPAKLNVFCSRIVNSDPLTGFTICKESRNAKRRAKNDKAWIELWRGLKEEFNLSGEVLAIAHTYNGRDMPRFCFYCE